MPAPWSTAATPRSRAGARSASGTTPPSHDLPARQRRRRRRIRLEGAAASTGIDEIPTWTNREATLARELPQQPARPRRRPDRLRAGPGLRPVRRPDDHRPVRTAARADGPPAQLRRAPEGARAGRGHRPDRRPGARGRERVPGTTARTSSTSTTARPRRVTPSCSRSGASSRSRTSVSSTTASTRPAGRRSRATAGCASPTACGSSATRPGPSCTPTRPTTRASSPSGWRSARPSSPTTAPCRGRRTRTRRRRRSGVTARGAHARPASTRSSSSPTSRRAPRATRSRPRFGHVTIVVDRATRELVGAAMACPDASAAIHECVVAIKAHVTIDVLADTIHAFPSTSRIFNGLFADALRELDGRDPRRRRPRARGRPGRRRARSTGGPRPALHPAPAGSSMAAEGMIATSARWPTVSRPRSRSPAVTRRVDARGAQRPLDRERLVRAEGGRAGRPARVLAPDGQRDPRPRVERLHRGVGPEGEDRPGRGKRAPGVAVPLGSVAPQPSRLGRVRPEMDGLDAGRDARRGEAGPSPPGRRAGGARSGHERAAAPRSVPARRARPGPRRPRSRGSGSRSRRPRRGRRGRAAPRARSSRSPRRRSGGSGWSGSGSMSARRAAVREPSEPSA